VNASQIDAERIAYQDPKVIHFLNDRQPKKIIFVKNKILNFIL
jgi:leucyl-tRNA synthetase